MNPIQIAIQRPIAVVAGVILIVLFGVVALQTIPIQLVPDVRKPVIEVRTNWPGAAPAEVEREIVNRQEDAFRGLDGLEELESSSRTGRGQVTLTFGVNQDMNRALLLVANRLDRIDGYPSEADSPTISTSGSEDNPITRMIVRRAPGNNEPIHTFRDFVDDVIQDRIERVPGVSGTVVYGGGARELRITVEPSLMARYGLTISEILDRVRAENASLSAGDIDEGKRRYVVRTEGELTTPEAVEQVVLRSIRDPDTGRVARVTVADVATVDFGYSTPRASIRRLGEPALSMAVTRETGANVIETMEGIRAVLDELNADALPRAGLEIVQTYDETVYIESAIALVRQNILVGGTLAAIVLLLFLRSWRPTLIVALAIPVSVIGSFVAMAALGRSINVISLAGIAFAVGMVVDAAIVVLENIYRLRERGLRPAEAAYKGATQVWSAILVSALTTVMVFIPILTMDLEVGQLFRDIAVAISVSVTLSLIVAVTLIPSLGSNLLTRVSPLGSRMRIPGLDDAARAFVRVIVAYTRLIIRRRIAALLVVTGITGIAIGATWMFLPKLDYLPEGNRNLIIGRIMPPPGYNLETNARLAQEVEDEMRPRWSIVSGPESEPGEPPKLSDFYFIALTDFTIVLGRSEEPARVMELMPVLREPVLREPGTFGFFTQASLFGRGIGGSRAVDLNISGPDLEENIEVANRAAEYVARALPAEDGHQFRPIPGLELGAPEVQVRPDRLRLADNAVTARELGLTVDTYNDGLRVAEITVDGRRIDLMLRGREGEIRDTQGIDFLPVVTGDGTIVSVNELSDVAMTFGPMQILHKERERTVTLQIRPDTQMPLEQAMEIIQSEVIAPLEADGLPPGMTLRLDGAADELTRTWDRMSMDLVLALIIVYLVMAVLFESFVYPLVIMFSVPLAMAGAIGGLALVNLYMFQPLDMLTLLGFVILIGIVVNNAILLVHQTLFHLRTEGMAVPAAIEEATRNRIRPIFMSTLTSVCGMLPLVIFPGAGSELYRGLGSVVLGGLSMSAVLTLAVVPPLLSVVVGPLEARRLAKVGKPVPQPAE